MRSWGKRRQNGGGPYVQVRFLTCKARKKSLSAAESKKVDLAVNLITQPTDNGDIFKDTEKVREITQRLTDTWSIL